MASGLLMGALGGLGQGMLDIAQRNREDEVFRMAKQAQIEREQRIEESAIRSEQRQEGMQIRQGQRQTIAHEAQRQSDLEFTTNPENVGRMTQAKLAELRAMDEYGDSRSDIEIAQAAKKAGAVDRATYHDNTDYAGRGLLHEKARLEIERLKNNPESDLKMTDRQKKRFDFLDGQLGRLNTQLGNETDDVERVKIRKQMDKFQKEIDQLTMSAYDAANAKPDLIGLEIQNEKLIKIAKSLDPDANIERSGDPVNDNSYLKELIDYMKSPEYKAEKKKKPSGLLGRGASGDF